MKRTFLLVYPRLLAGLLGMLLAALVLVEAGCARKLDDAQMSSQIQTKFSEDSGLSSKQLTVQANDGVVTLSGAVDNEAQREAAGKQAASVAGVKTVINNLQVSGASMAAAATPAAAEKPTPSTPTPNATTPAPPKTTPAKKPTKARAEAAANPPDNTQSDDNAQPADTTQAANDTPPADATPATPPADTPPPPPPPPAPKKLIIDQGTQLTVRLIDPIDSEKNQTGDTFRATLNAPLTSDGEEAVPAGVELVGHLVDVKSASKFSGKSDIVMQLDSLSSAGRTYSLQTDQYRKEGASRGKGTAEKVGGGAVIGSIIGALAGGGKGAAIGAAAGAGVGGGAQAASKGGQIKLPSETVLSFTLQAPITVVQSPADANRQKLGQSQ